MSTVITSQNSNAPWYSKVVPPVARGLAGWYCADTASGRAAFNRVLDRPNGTIAGAPVPSANSVKFVGNSAYIETGIAETAEMTIIALLKTQNPVSAAAQVYAVSSYASPDIGLSLYSNVAGFLVGAAARTNGSGGQISGAATIAAPDQTWVLASLTVSAAQTKLRNLTAGTSALGSSSASRVVAGAGLRIGSSRTAGGANAGEINISHAIVYTAALSDEEIDQIAVLMRKRAMRLGIVA